MKRLIITTAILFGLSIGAFAEYDGGLFQRGAVSDEEYYGAGYYYNRDGSTLPLLPYQHNLEGNQPAPIGSGAMLLAGLGIAYALGKKNKKKE